jgi:hypothetical protein
MTTLYVHIFGSVHNSFSHYQHCSDLWTLKIKRDRILSNYAIVYMSEQKYKLAIPFAEHNLGPFGRIFIAIFLFESLSITLCGVFIFSSLYLVSNVYLLVLSRYINFHFWPDCELIATGNTNLKRQQCDVCAIYIWLWKCQKSIPKVRVYIYVKSAQCLLFPGATIQ